MTGKEVISLLAHNEAKTLNCFVDEHSPDAPQGVCPCHTRLVPRNLESELGDGILLQGNIILITIIVNFHIYLEACPLFSLDPAQCPNGSALPCGTRACGFDSHFWVS